MGGGGGGGLGPPTYYLPPPLGKGQASMPWPSHLN